MKLSQYLSLLSDVQVTPVESDIYNLALELPKNQYCKLNDYRSKALLIVNIASKCGFTNQLKQLEALYKTYHNKGLNIIGVPSNDFFQEPNDDEQIQQFCLTDYGVSFPVTKKTQVRGAGKNPIYAFLTSSKTNPHYSGPIRWNFTKFLIDQNGNVIKRFAPYTKPYANKVIRAIENLLKP